MKTVILHIGQTKTATTSQQALLSANRTGLEAEGLLYPVVPANHPNKRQHRFLTEALMADPAELARAWRGIAAQIEASPAPTVLLSEELMWHLDDQAGPRQRERLERLRGHLEGFEVRVLVYLRRQDHWIESWHNQVVKTGVRQRAGLDLEAFVAAHEQAHLLDYERQLQAWADVFGAAAITVREFHPERLHRQDPLADLLLQVLGRPDRDGLGATPPLQRSLAPAALEAARRYNQLPGAARHKAAHIRALNALNPQLRRGGQRLSAATANRLRLRCGPGNAEVARRFLAPGETLFADWLERDEPECPEAVDPAELSSLMAQLFIAQQDQLARLEQRIERLERRPGAEGSPGTAGSVVPDPAPDGSG